MQKGAQAALDISQLLARFQTLDNRFQRLESAHLAANAQHFSSFPTQGCCNLNQTAQRLEHQLIQDASRLKSLLATQAFETSKASQLCRHSSRRLRNWLNGPTRLARTSPTSSTRCRLCSSYRKPKEAIPAAAVAAAAVAAAAVAAAAVAAAAQDLLAASASTPEWGAGNITLVPTTSSN